MDSHVFIISQILKFISGDVKAHDCIIRLEENRMAITVNIYYKGVKGNAKNLQRK